MVPIALMGLNSYRFLGIGWLLHTGWDILHYLYGHPILPFAATSSLGCAICDPVIAIWFLMGAPTKLNVTEMPDLAERVRQSPTHRRKRHPQ